MESAKWKCLLGFHLILIQSVIATHFRGIVIMIRPTNSGDDHEMEISYHVSWRRDHDDGGNCDNETISSGKLISVPRWMSCQKGCDGVKNSMMRMDYNCTDYSITENWSFGGSIFRYKFSSSEEEALIFFEGANWIAPINDKWYAKTWLNFSKRNDTGKINSTPRAIMIPVVKLKEGCTHTIPISVSDPDSDIIQCRWAQGYNECGSACDKFPNATLNSDSCIISYDAVYGTGILFAALMLEDFLPGFDKPLSSVSLQFLVEVYNTNGTCTSQPKFIPPTMLSGSCVAIPLNTIYTSQLIADSGVRDQTIVDIITVSPQGMTKSPLHKGSDSKVSYVNISWEPQKDQINQIYSFCYSAVTSEGLSSEQSCIQYMIGSHAPAVTYKNVSLNKQSMRKYQFALKFDKPILLPQSDARVYFKEYGTNNEVYNVNIFTSTEVNLSGTQTLTITPNFYFPENTKLYFEFERGIVVGLDGCKPGMEPITDKNFWVFMTLDLTPPQLLLLNPLTKTNTTAYFQWSINEPAQCLCSIDFKEIKNCSQGALKVENLKEGEHIFLVQYSDFYNNTGTTTHTFTVDLTSPNTTIRSVPSVLSSESRYTFLFSCDELQNDCQYYCNFYIGDMNYDNYTDCLQNSYATPKLVNGENYTLSVHATDSVLNTGKPSFYKWTADFVAPTIHITETTMQCSGDEFIDNISPPEVLDNIDQAPKLNFSDRNAPCALLRTWTAVDAAGNKAQMEQNITKVFTPTISLLPSLSFPCSSGSPKTDIPTDTAKIPNPCQLPLEVSFTDTPNNLNCPGQFTRKWLLNNTCTGVDVFAQQVISLYDPCPHDACGQNYSDPHGICHQGKCLCKETWFGDSCEILIQEPKIRPVDSKIFLEYQNIEFNFTLLKGSEPIAWNIISAPDKTILEYTTGKLYLNKAQAGNWNFIVSAENQRGEDVLNVTAVVKSTYTATLHAIPNETIANAYSIILNGSVTYAAESPIRKQLNASVPIVVDIYHMSTKAHRSINGLTDQKGQFSVIYYKGSLEYGKYEALARHPSESFGKAQIRWKILGMKTIQKSVSLYAEMNGPGMQFFQNITLLINDGPEDLHLVKARPMMENLYTGLKVNISFGGRKERLDKLATGCAEIINIAIETPGALHSKLLAIIETLEGVRCSLSVDINVARSLPVFYIDPPKLEASITRNIQKSIEFEITNIGPLSATNVSLILPQSNMFKLSAFGVNTQIRNNVTLHSQEKASVSLLITMPLEQPLGIIQGSFYLKSTETDADIPFKFLITSSTLVNLTITVEDEYTYFAAEKPLVSNAYVTITNSERNTIVSGSTSENNGRVSFMNLQEDIYDLHVSASDHGDLRQVITISPNEPHMTLFLQRQAITIKWSVVPTTIVDVYDITLEADFKVNVPMPVVTIMPNQINLEDIVLGLINDVILFNVTNHGLIRADNISLEMPTAQSGFHFAVLTDIPSSIAAKQSFLIPVRVSQSKMQKRSVSFQCFSGMLIYGYLCKTWQIRSDLIIFNGGCSLSVLENSNGFRASGGPLVNIHSFNTVTFDLCDKCLQALLNILKLISPAGRASHVIKMIKKYSKTKLNQRIAKVVNSKIKYQRPPADKERDLSYCTDLVKGGTVPDNIIDELKYRSCLQGEPARYLWAVIDVSFECSKVIFNYFYNSPKNEKVMNYGGLRERYPKYEKVINYVESLFPSVFRLIYLESVFGDEIWLRYGNSKWTAKVLLPAFDDASDLGHLVSPKELQIILGGQFPEGITRDATEQLLNRFNITLTNWQSGILEPSNETDETISYSLLQHWQNAIVEYNNKAKQRGFSSYIEAYKFDSDEIKKIENIEEDNGVCAIVRIQINQTATLTRQGFIASLEIDNKGKELMKDIKVEINIYDKRTLILATEKFAIGAPIMTGSLSGVDGNGTISQGTSGSSKWLIIPYTEAALTETPIPYNIGGRLLYSTSNDSVDIPFHPTTIFVHPDPSLIIHYFWEKYVYSDDPFTSDIEPAIPFTLGIMVKNEGYGTASQMKIKSAQPEIIDNEKGLLISFEILMSSIDNKPVNPSLIVDFGDIVPNTTKTARWWMTSSLIGEFIGYNATFVNTNPLGDPKLSLIDNLTIHELIQNVRIPDDQDDVLDFLVNDIKDQRTLPDRLYSSVDMSYQPVSKGNITEFQHQVAGETLQLHLKVSALTGWNFFTLQDDVLNGMPVGKSLRLSRARENRTSSDSVLLPCENAWISVEVAKRRRKKFLNILDFNDGRMIQSYVVEICRNCLPSLERTLVNCSSSLSVNMSTYPNPAVTRTTPSSVKITSSFFEVITKPTPNVGTVKKPSTWSVWSIFRPFFFFFF